MCSVQGILGLYVVSRITFISPRNSLTKRVVELPCSLGTISSPLLQAHVSTWPKEFLRSMAPTVGVTSGGKGPGIDRVAPVFTLPGEIGNQVRIPK